MRIEKDQKRTLATVGILVAAFVVGLWLPHRLQERRLHQQIKAAQKQLGFDRASSQGLGKLARDVIALREVTDQSQKYVPQETELAPLLRQLSTNLQTLDTSDQVMETETSTTGQDYSVIPVTLKFKGSFPSAFGFIKNIESMRRLVRITRLYARSDASKPGEPLTVEIQICAFSSSSEEAPTP